MSGNGGILYATLVWKTVWKCSQNIDDDGIKNWSREMGGLVGSAPACYGSSLGSNPDISQKYNVGNKSRGVAVTL
jgi:hypothetical protein